MKGSMNESNLISIVCCSSFVIQTAIRGFSYNQNEEYLKQYFDYVLTINEVYNYMQIAINIFRESHQYYDIHFNVQYTL